VKRALVVGINHYQHASALNGCINDAQKIHALISKNANNSPNFDSKLLTSDTQQITTTSLKGKLDELLSKPADMAFFYFSGHGAASNLGGSLCTYEAKKYQEGVSMQEVLTYANNSPVKEVIIILDCCFSGAFGNIPALSNHQVSVREGISILTASRDSESSIEINGSGIFTSLVCDALEGGAADLRGIVTPAGVYSHVEQSFGAWEQRPLFKSYVSRSTPLRTAKPPIDVQLLREISNLFHKPENTFALDPTYEETEKRAVPENVKKFKQLKQLQTVGLVHVNGYADLYWASMNSSSCQLTALGRFYWNLVNAGKI
jgi:uncharacterized caspase-like protein